MKRTILTAFAALALMAGTAQAFNGAVVYRGAILVGSTSIPALCAKSLTIGIQCFTTDAHSKGRVDSGSIDNSAPLGDPDAAMVWASDRFGGGFTAIYKANNVRDANGVIISHEHNRW